MAPVAAVIESDTDVRGPDALPGLRPATPAPRPTAPRPSDASRAPLGRLAAPWPRVDGDERPATGWAVAMDGSRPVALWLPDGAFHRVVPISLRVRPDDAPRSALLRALARPAGRRFDPLVCVDAGGHLIGVVPIEHLAREIALGG
jgi:hypothetical protein